MNKQRKVLITITYNEMGIIIDTKAEEVAQPERKKGEWIVDDEFIDCSVCRREKWSRIPYGDLVRRFRYCPNCGARMEGLNETD